MEELFGNPYAGLLGQDEERIAQQARMQGLLGLASSLFEAGAPSPVRQGLGAALGRGIQAYQQGSQGTFDQALKSMLVRQQLDEAKKKREREENLQRAIASSITTKPIPGLGLGQQQVASPITQAELESFGPDAYLSAARTAAPTVRTMDRDKALQALAQYGGLEGLGTYLTATKPQEDPETIRTLEILAQRPELAGLQASLKRAGATNISVGKPGEQFVTKLATQITSFRDRGMDARGALLTIQAMSDLLESGVQTGFGQESMLGLQRAGQLFNPDFKVKETAGQEAFLGAANEIILPQVKMLGVNPTDNDLKFIERGSPTLGKSVEGNRLMLDALNIKFQRDALLQEFASDWQARNATLINTDPVVADSRFNQDLVNLTKTHPLYTQAAEQLKRRYQSITGSKPTETQPLLRQGGFIN
jgi:hypothetical protein